MSSSMTGSGKHNDGHGRRSNVVFSEFDTEYACSDHAMVRHVVQTAVRNYFAASCTSPAHMTICIDFTEGAPIPSNSTTAVRYQAPLVQINVERKPDSKTTNVTTAAAKESGLPATSTAEKADGGKSGAGKENLLLNATEKLSAFTIKEEANEDLRPVNAITEILKSKIPLQNVHYLKCAEKQIAEKKVFEHLPVTYERLMTHEMLAKWRTKYEEDKHTLYSDRQATTNDNSSSPVKSRSDTSISFHEKGVITMDNRTDGWDEPAGILSFEPADNRGNVSKAVQIRGNLPSTLQD
ncbi:unnamed protein product [Litomosoides sigmodontis]|uniref:Uncharacterized protein n=1 Tax=Litomosoides sigmodontis TaxID=42156 RepID=A0A3P6THR9_LITSI|nr:unnamed protein product [Litomosoides sigmodontis]